MFRAWTRSAGRWPPVGCPALRQSDRRDPAQQRSALGGRGAAHHQLEVPGADHGRPPRGPVGGRQREVRHRFPAHGVPVRGGHRRPLTLRTASGGRADFLPVSLHQCEYCSGWAWSRAEDASGGAGPVGVARHAVAYRAVLCLPLGRGPGRCHEGLSRIVQHVKPAHPGARQGPGPLLTRGRAGAPCARMTKGAAAAIRRHGEASRRGRAARAVGARARPRAPGGLTRASPTGNPVGAGTLWGSRKYGVRLPISPDGRSAIELRDWGRSHSTEQPDE